MGLGQRELILGGKCDKAPGQKYKQYIYQLAEYIQLKPVQATKIHLVDSISVHSNIKQRTVLPTERVIVYFLAKSYIAELSIHHYKNFLYVFSMILPLFVSTLHN